MPANYDSDDMGSADTGAANSDIEAQLEQMRLETVDALRKQFAADNSSAPTQQQDIVDSDQAPISVFIGANGRGLTNDAARLMAGRLNRFNADDGVTYKAEEHGDPGLPNEWAVVGRKVAQPVADETASNNGDELDVATTIAPKNVKELGIIANARRKNNESNGTAQVLEPRKSFAAGELPSSVNYAQGLGDAHLTSEAPRRPPIFSSTGLWSPGLI